MIITMIIINIIIIVITIIIVIIIISNIITITIIVTVTVIAIVIIIIIIITTVIIYTEIYHRSSYAKTTMDDFPDITVCFIAYWLCPLCKDTQRCLVSEYPDTEWPLTFMDMHLG